MNTFFPVRPASTKSIAKPARAPLRSGFLQRKCACGAPTATGGECTECGKKKKSLQAKLAIGASNDPLEHEADRVAEQVLATPAQQTGRGAIPNIQRVSGSLTGGTNLAPASVERVLASRGSPLETALQHDLSQRFGHDFAQVRIHSDASAEESAQDVGANAYTVGHQIVFGPGKFAPGTTEGKRLLAHELVHVAQQGATSIHGSTTLQRDEPDGPRDAGVPPAAGVPDTESDQRKCVARLGGCGGDRPGGIPTRDDIKRYNNECRPETGYSGPDLQGESECISEPEAPEPPKQENKAPEVQPPPGGNMAHRKLSKNDKDAVVAGAGGSVATGPGPTFSKDGPRFVLHDTATSYGKPATEAKHLAELKAHDSTPVGEGTAAYVTAAGAPERTHSKFFNAQRPTATEFERGNDLMDLFTRETNMQQIFSLTDPAEQNAAITRFLAHFPGLSGADIKNETNKAAKNLDPTQSTPSNKPGAKNVVMTTASGAVSEICDVVAAGGAAKVAVKGQEKALDKACASIKPVYDARKTRIADTTNVEIVADKGTDCDTSSSATPFSGYAAAAYDAVAKLYSLAALESGQFPEITTHYFLDSTTPAGSPGPVTKSQNRCDPRCFDLDLLYAKIAAIFNHPAGTTYGITPNYGTKWGTSNVWWPTNVCGSTRGTPASGAAAPPAKKKTPPSKTKKKKIGKD